MLCQHENSNLDFTEKSINTVSKLTADVVDVPMPYVDPATKPKECSKIPTGSASSELLVGI